MLKIIVETIKTNLINKNLLVQELLPNLTKKLGQKKYRIIVNLIKAINDLKLKNIIRTKRFNVCFINCFLKIINN